MTQKENFVAKLRTNIETCEFELRRAIREHEPHYYIAELEVLIAELKEKLDQLLNQDAHDDPWALEHKQSRDVYSKAKSYNDSEERSLF